MAQHKGLFRSRADSLIGGVAGGIATALNIDSIIIRVILILLIFPGGSGLILYLILWIALPLEPLETLNSSDMDNEQKTTGQQPEFKEPQKDNWPKGRNDGSLIAGLILITLGIIFLIIRFIPRIDFGDLWPIILVVAGVALLRASYTKTKSN